ncbi:MAG: hypothetical protein RMJ98_04505 [Myxococcales bacterium]|nr:hypothetical protein [Polyangiaceae bacterium]MDW8248553.1 hypothetical protein [Myxococcales bacterium]
MTPKAKELIGDHPTLAVTIDRRRYARHLTLPGVGEQGQRRLHAASVEIQGSGLRGWVARRYLEAAGVGEVRQGARGSEGPRWLLEELVEGPSREVTAGALEALEQLREALKAT